MTTDVSHTPSSLESAVQAHLDQSNARVAKLEHQRQLYWVKREEGLSLRMRLQKGYAATSFEAEHQALHQLNALNVPVPEIISEGADYFVLPDSGHNLQYVLRHSDYIPHECLPAFSHAGDALADLHAKGISHGRPVIRDFCWRAPNITLLDFERFSPKRNTARGHVQDLLIFAHSALTRSQGFTPELAAALEAYRAKNPGETWERTTEYCARLGWVNWLTKPVQWRGRGKAKEFKAIPMVLDLFAGRNVVQPADL